MYIQWDWPFQSKVSDPALCQRIYAERQQRQRKRQNTWRRGRTMVLIALQHASLNFSRKLAGVQIICDGYGGQKNRRQHSERDHLHANSVKQRSLAHTPAVNYPKSPKGDRDRKPDEIG